MSKDTFSKKGLYVPVINNNLGQALTKLKRLINEDGLKKEMRKREYFQSKGEKKRRALAAAKRRHMKSVSEASKQDYMGSY